MKRFSVFVIATAVTLGGAGVRVSDLEAQDQPAVHHIDVVLNQTASGFEVLAPCKAHKVDRAAQGDTVEWHFHNRASVDTGATIGNFGPSPRFPENDARRKPTPFDSACKQLSVDVPRHNPKEESKAVVKCNIRKDFVGVTPTKALTYKYAILGKDGKVLLDPEIEIEK